MILICLFSAIAYVVLNNVSIMTNNLGYTENSQELNRSLEDKANINLKAAVEYYLN
jgi:hypothetical protein